MISLLSSPSGSASVGRWIRTQQSYHYKNAKRVYYYLWNFLIGRLLGTNIINSKYGDQTKAAMDRSV